MAILVLVSGAARRRGRGAEAKPYQELLKFEATQRTFPFVSSIVGNLTDDLGNLQDVTL